MSGTAASIEQWGIFELTLAGPSGGNPFADVSLSAEFRQRHRGVEVDGFYDGDGTYRVRFMPDALGEWSYRTRSGDPALDGKTGAFRCIAPSARNHGPVRVAGTYHFAYADRTPYRCFGTTCYGWVNQKTELQEQTVRTLATAPFNKLRMCIFPKNYAYNRHDPPSYPYVRRPDGSFDLRRFDPAFWHNYETRIGQLRDLNIEADVILWHPYDEGKWGFDRMDAASDEFYLRYALARLAAYRNVWWSLANEWDFMRHKTEGDFERFFRLIQTHDPYQHLRSIHNGAVWYDHGKPWVTHASVQHHDPAQTPRLRAQYQKPIVYDECCYEGDVEWIWGNIDAQEMVRRFWKGFSRGGYVGHGETYVRENGVLWWSHGGELHGQSPARIALLKKVIEDAPAALAPMDLFSWEGAIGCCGVPGEYYLIYFGKYQPAAKDLPLPADKTYRIEIIDTWEMAIAALPGEFSGTCRVKLPGRPFQALRIRRV